MTPFTITKIPFKLRGLSGEATAEYGINDNPIRWGFGKSVLGEAYPPKMALGFPVVQASVAYEGEGYAAVMGWVQVVRYRLEDTNEQVTVFDVAPQITDTEVPYISFGVRPTLFDAPGITRPEVTWDADSFLVHTPDGVLSRVINSICGFKWGYLVREGKVEPLPLTLADESDWDRNLPDLRRRYPTWTFGSSWSR
ncbi:MAG TPA: hypothetical protein VGR25_12365 [bacterium]|jgi:hypothetical protein|nr:hypothetical protein [bacterium]